MAKLSTIEWLHPTHRLACPCCSAVVLKDDGKPAKSLCSHFLFSWEDDKGDFADCTDEVESALEDSTSKVVDPTDESFLAVLPSSAVVYQIETRDHACGPVVHTDVVGFNPLAA